jgi:hypothetical protein
MRRMKQLRTGRYHIVPVWIQVHSEGAFGVLFRDSVPWMRKNIDTVWESARKVEHISEYVHTKALYTL